MDALFVSTFSVAIAEIGDKTQLLAFLLATRFKRAFPIIAGIFVATLLNHAAAAYIGDLVSGWFSADILKWLVGLSFILVAAWILIPDKLDKEESQLYKYGPFIASLVLFFFAEMGDKTQVATVLLAAKYDALFMVITGTTIGMLLANIPVVLLGKFSAQKLPLKSIRIVTAALFLILGVSTLLVE